MTALLEARGLALPGRLESTGLVVEAASLVALVGPNGSGKTSLLHALARIGAVRGEVRIDGSDPDALAPDARRRLLAYLPATRDVAWPVTARDLVALGGGQFDDVAAALDLEPLADRRMDQLSTGERSRVLLARALAPRPRLLLLDEPAANLDPAWQLRLMAVLREAVAGGQAVIAAFHDLDLAARYADRMLVMSGGRVVADGVPAEVLAGAHLREVFGIRRGEKGWELAEQAPSPRHDGDRTGPSPPHRHGGLDPGSTSPC
ncbi:MAG: iron complex transport system ATP-binding protein [Sphingomonadales bacterium]|nr:iron complex transport system ATP-binding protein [Sphingomonadales bacterium]